MKKCSKCETEKNDDDFYKGSAQCKTCYIARVKAYREKNIEKIRRYDRERGNRQSPDYLKSFREKYPNKYKAHNIVNNSIRDGKLFSEGCESCGSDGKTHAHHDDYLKPLNVRWLCAACHSQWHAENGEAKNP